MSGGGGEKAKNDWQCGFTERTWASESDSLEFKSGFVTYYLSKRSEVKGLHLALGVRWGNKLKISFKEGLNET